MRQVQSQFDSRVRMGLPQGDRRGMSCQANAIAWERRMSKQQSGCRLTAAAVQGVTGTTLLGTHRQERPSGLGNECHLTADATRAMCCQHLRQRTRAWHFAEALPSASRTHKTVGMMGCGRYQQRCASSDLNSTLDADSRLPVGLRRVSSGWDTEKRWRLFRRLGFPSSVTSPLSPSHLHRGVVQHVHMRLKELSNVGGQTAAQCCVARNISILVS